MSQLWDAVLFDWDDTLCGAEPHRYAYARQVAAELGVALEPAEVYAAFARAGDSAAGAWGAFIERLPRALGIPTSHEVAFVERYRQRDLIKTFRLFDDVLTAFDRLADAGLRVGVVSNNDEAADRVRELNVRHHVEIVVSPATFGVGKPDPRIFAESLALMRVEASRSLYVGDSFDHDVAGARAAGMTPVLIDRFGINLRADDALRITGLDELVALVAGIAGRP